MTAPTYTFVSVSTAKPGRLDDLAALASRPSEQMDGKVAGMLARQVSVDRDRNTVIVWVTFARRSDLYDHLATDRLGRLGVGRRPGLPQPGEGEGVAVDPVGGGDAGQLRHAADHARPRRGGMGLG